jgi:hypothetical protein
MTKQVFYDTNIYRYLEKYIFHGLKTEEERNLFLKKWKTCEEEKGYKPVLNILVVFELISHLADTNNPSFNESLNAIKVISKHFDNDFIIIPVPDVYFSKIFYEKNLSSEDFLKTIKKVIINLSNTKPPFTGELIERIKNMSFILNEFENEMISIIKEDINITNKKTDEWIIFKNNEKKRQQLNKLLKNKDSFVLRYYAYAFLIRINLILNQNIELESEEEISKKVSFLIENHSAPFLLIKELNRKLKNDGYKLFNQSNQMTDCLISFGVSKVGPVYLISNDKQLYNLKVDEIIEYKKYFIDLGLIELTTWNNQ